MRDMHKLMDVIGKLPAEEQLDLCVDLVNWLSAQHAVMVPHAGRKYVTTDEVVYATRNGRGVQVNTETFVKALAKDHVPEIRECARQALVEFERSRG